MLNYFLLLGYTDWVAYCGALIFIFFIHSRVHSATKLIDDIGQLYITFFFLLQRLYFKSKEIEAPLPTNLEYFSRGSVGPKTRFPNCGKNGNLAGLLFRRIWYSVGKSGVLGITEYCQGRPLICVELFCNVAL